MRIEIKPITANQVLPVRQKVLRAGRPIQEAIFDGDEKKTTLHLAAFQEEQILGVATFLKMKHEAFPAKNQYRLRGMAVLPEYQGQQLGKKILEEGINLLTQDHTDLLWFNARTSAAGFYKKNGFLIKGEPFDIPDVGEHVLMYKNLSL